MELIGTYYWNVLLERTTESFWWHKSDSLGISLPFLYLLRGCCV
nr:MAG TPA: hypothetical protein [Caudoviricetes sp.]